MSLMNLSDVPPQCCVICLEPISNYAGVIDCDHIFCKSCIAQWSEKSSSCPLCRKEITKIRVFYRSFFMGEEITVKHKQQKVEENEPEIGESDFEVADSEEEIIYNSQNSQKDIIEYDENCGTSMQNGLRRTTRETHQDLEIQEALIEFRIQLQQQNTTQRIIRNQLRFLVSYIEKLQNNGKFGQIQAQHIINEVSKEIERENGNCDDQKIKQMVNYRIFKKSLQKVSDIPKVFRSSTLILV